MLHVQNVKERRGKRSNLILLFDRKWSNWNPLRLITWVARQPKDSSNCPFSFMLVLWKILLPLVTILYEMRWLEVLVPTLAGDPTMTLKISFNYHCQTSSQNNGKETAAIWPRNNAIMQIAQQLSPSLCFGNAISLNYMRHCIWVVSSFGSLLITRSSLLLQLCL